VQTTGLSPERALQECERESSDECFHALQHRGYLGSVPWLVGEPRARFRRGHGGRSAEPRGEDAAEDVVVLNERYGFVTGAHRGVRRLHTAKQRNICECNKMVNKVGDMCISTIMCLLEHDLFSIVDADDYTRDTSA